MTDTGHNDMVVCMIPAFNKLGGLPPGVHNGSWDEFVERFGWNRWRMRLLKGLGAALEELRAAGCTVAYIDGSFVTSKDYPRDYDGCWSPAGVDPEVLDPVFWDPPNPLAQKTRYLGELYPDILTESRSGLSFREFFQVDKETGQRKGIVALDLRRLP